MPKGVYKRTRKELERLTNKLKPFRFNGGEGNPKWIDGRFTKNLKYYQDFLKKWKKRNRGKCNVYNQKYRIRKYEADGSFTPQEWETLKAQYNWTCPHCGKREPEIKLTIDHIIPLSRGGSNNIENIQPLCGICNSKKGNKI